MARLKISNFIRMNPAALVERAAVEGETLVVGPYEFVAQLKPRLGIVVATWDRALQLGCASRFGIVLGVAPEGVRVCWSNTDATYRPGPTARQFWVQEKPFFRFAKEVVDRYMLAATFAEYFPENLEFGSSAPRPPRENEARPSTSPTGGYVYLVKSPHGIKIGKSVNVKTRTRLFEVKLPFPITVEHYAWFDDYSHAERALHKQFHQKRLEGEWFNLSPEDVAHIKTLGQAVSMTSP